MLSYKSTLSTLTLASAALLTACSSTPVAQAPEASATPKAVAADTAPKAKPESTVAAVVVPDYLDPKNPLSTQRSVYFDFDDFSVKKDYVALIERHGKYLAGNTKVAIRVEGHADERGGSEYNLALGQKRAEAVARALKTFGVKDGQVEPVSFGKEKPKALGHDEAAWAQNRRADLAYPAK